MRRTSSEACQPSVDTSSLQSRLPKLLVLTWILAIETIKILYIATCDCRAVGQPFNAWFFPAFQHWPYSYWWTYHGLTWLAGPYSLFWWGLNVPATLGYGFFFGYLLVVDALFGFWLSRRSWVYACYYLAISVWFTTLDPVDFFPILFAVAGRYRLAFLIFAPIVKLPVLAPLWVWNWTFTNANSLQGPENYGRYLILGVVWTLSLGLYLQSRFHWLPSKMIRLHTPVDDSVLPSRMMDQSWTAGEKHRPKQSSRDERTGLVHEISHPVNAEPTPLQRCNVQWWPLGYRAVPTPLSGEVQWR